MTKVDLSSLFDGSINISLTKDEGEFSLEWDDGVAGEWSETYFDLGIALARAAVLAECANLEWKADDQTDAREKLG